MDRNKIILPIAGLGLLAAIIFASTQIPAIMQFVQGTPTGTIVLAPVPGGPELYVALCSSCHSAAPPSSWRTGRTEQQLTDSISYGGSLVGGTMPAYSGLLTGAQSSAIVQYVRGSTTSVSVNIPSGPQLYATICSSCHSVTPPGAWRTGRTTEQLTASINNGGLMSGGTMPSYSGLLTVAQTSAIVQFIRGTGTPAPALTSAPTPVQTLTPAAGGAQLYASNCSRCHTNPPPVSWQSSRTASQLTGSINNGVNGMPAYSGVLTPAQVSAIVQYIQGGAVSTNTPTPTPASTSTPTPATIGGAQLYASYCSGCHSTPPPGLWGVSLSSSQLTNAINNGVSGMPAYSGALTPAKISAIVQYIQGGAVSVNTPTPTPAPTPTPTPATIGGAQLYASYCSGCHSTPPPGIWEINLSSSQLTNAINNGVSGMPAYSGLLTPAQVSSVVQYIQTAATTAPTPTPTPVTINGAELYSINCSGCHGTPPGSWLTRSAAQLTSDINTGPGSMPGYSGVLTSPQISAIVEYILSIDATTTATQALAPPTPTTTSSAAGGSQLYATHCSSCHGTPPSSWRTSLSTSQLTSDINTGPGSMPSYSGVLTSAQVSTIVQYIQGSTTTSTPTATGGTQLYAANCARCHNTPPPNSWRSQSVSSLTSVIRNGEEDMPGFSNRLSSEQISAIVQYIRGFATATLPSDASRDND